MATLSFQIHGNPRDKSLFVSRVFSNRSIFSLSCHVPLKTITLSQQNQPPSSYCESIRAEIEAHLTNVIPLKPPLSVFEPMRQLTFSAPYDPSSALCVAACELVGGDRSQAMAAAAALHLMHAAAFVHENLPLTDGPQIGPNYNSKSKYKVNHAFQPNIELLVPDAMVPFGFELLATSDDPAQDMSGRILRVMVEITRVVGSQGIVDAQYQESLVSRSNDRDRGKLCDIAWVDDMCRKKEGALYSCAAACGAILGGANEEEVEKLRSYGLYVGMIKGYSIRVESKGKVFDRVVELRNLALEELEHFKGNGKKVDAISSFVIFGQ